jgi:uncharacterized coiled-coil protein SlyX
MVAMMRVRSSAGLLAWFAGVEPITIAPRLEFVRSPSRKANMSDGPDNLVVVYLRRIDAKVDRLIDNVQDLKHRVTSLEGRVAGLQSEIGSIRGDMAAMSLRIDRIETRLDHIERRLDLVTAPTT